MNTSKIKQISVPLDVVLGSTHKTIDFLATMGEGTIIELESMAGEPVELRASGEVIARGEVVVIEEKFGLRVTELITRED